MGDPAGGRALGEFALIAEYFAPLATAPGALALSDDAALFEVPPGHAGVVTTDAMVEGIHFFAADAARTVGWKLLAVNLSDLAAMGAQPIGYTLALALPEGWRADWLADFASGLKDCQEHHGISLLGGDTVRASGSLTGAITALGAVPLRAELRRSGAEPGHDIWVSGTIGDAALTVKMRKGWIPPAAVDTVAMAQRLDRPAPRLALGQGLRGYALAAIDVSDGLAADLGHICDQSGVGAEVRLADIPLSPAVAALLAADPDLAATIVTGGDDYELLFTAAAQDAGAVRAAADASGTPVSRIGRITVDPGVRVIGPDGRPLTLAALGFSHF